jgi:hypothetical protein
MLIAEEYNFYSLVLAQAINRDYFEDGGGNGTYRFRNIRTGSKPSL